ncbi:MAG: 4-(cytidine 5'-diphospho)-2-C-methyl-D-erythritol kinase, partial [Selenomonas artemidis]
MVTIFGYAKINLTLDILGLRDDGYHEIATVMQSLALKDTLTLRRREEGIGLSVDVPGLESDERNLAYRAAALLIEACGVRGGVDIDIVKRIPVAAGLAGGSADAAATLRGMNALYDLGLTDEELCGFGARIGSDIPF